MAVGSHAAVQASHRRAPTKLAGRRYRPSRPCRTHFDNNVSNPSRPCPTHFDQNVSNPCGPCRTHFDQNQVDPVQPISTKMCPTHVDHVGTPTSENKRRPQSDSPKKGGDASNGQAHTQKPDKGLRSRQKGPRSSRDRIGKLGEAIPSDGLTEGSTEGQPKGNPIGASQRVSAQGQPSARTAGRGTGAGGQPGSTKAGQRETQVYQRATEANRRKKPIDQLPRDGPQGQPRATDGTQGHTGQKSRVNPAQGPPEGNTGTPGV